MSNKYNVLLKDTLIFAIGNMGSRLILFFLVPLYTNFLSTSEYGTAELLFTLSELIIPFLTFVIHDAVLRFGLSPSEKTDNVIYIGLIVWIASLFIALLIIPGLRLSSSLYPWRWYFYIYLITRSLNAIEMNYLKVKDMNKYFAISSILQTLILAALNIVLLACFHLGITGYILANVIAYIIIDIFNLIISKMHIALKNANFDKELLARMLKFSAPMIFTNISWWVVNSSDKIMIQWLVGASALGIYTVAAKIPSLINVFANIFSQAWGISSVREIETSNDVKFYGDIFSIFCSSVYFVCVLLVSIIHYFMKIYVDAEFYDAWQYVPLLLVSAAFAAITTFYGSMYSALKVTTHSMTTTIIGAVVNIAVNLALIPHFQIWGAVVGTVLSYFVVTILRMVDVRRYIQFDVHIKKFVINNIIIIVQSLLVTINWNIILVSTISIVLFCINNYNEARKITQRIRHKMKRKG